MKRTEAKKLEKVPIATIYSQGGYITIQHTGDCTDSFKLYGFLKVYITKLGKELERSMERLEDET